jgi:hypothetical protein
MKEGEYKGIDCVGLRPTKHMKNNAITMQNNVIDEPTGDQKFQWIPDIPGDEYCFYKLIHRHVFEYLPPDAQDLRIFRREAPNKLLKKWKKFGLSWRANPAKNGVYGKNYINVQLKALAHICNYENPDRCTAHGKRKYAVSALVNSSENIASKEVCNRTRHKSDSVNRK